MNFSVFVIVLNYKGKEDTKECIESILKSSYPHYKIIVVDNGSFDGSVPFLKQYFSSLVFLETEVNLGYAGGNNVGIRYALSQGADFIFILNNDTVIDERCIEQFVNASKRYPQAILGARIYTYTKPHLLHHSGGMWNAKRAIIKGVPEHFADPKDWNDPKELDVITGCGLFAPSFLFKAIGLFEESFFLYYEESDWCYRAKRRGFSSIYIPEALLWHKESRSFVEPKPPQFYFQWRNRFHFIKRNFSSWTYLYLLFVKLSTRSIMLFLKYVIKSLDRFVTQAVLHKPFSREKALSWKSYRAGLYGIRDYFLGRMGSGPNWIFSKDP